MCSVHCSRQLRIEHPQVSLQSRGTHAVQPRNYKLLSEGRRKEEPINAKKAETSEQSVNSPSRSTVGGKGGRVTRGVETNAQ
ncbi:unnamed protein product [Pieris macdunnoughi]|uniref:Uncharacterized protein n=1 Tax=Pieris macdunnoughi TaxID=345717 RepID=A0A821T0E0_9NEOP|nr:unnamed protein product [Pieris macdunnoughi]